MGFWKSVSKARESVVDADDQPLKNTKDHVITRDDMMKMSFDDLEELERTAKGAPTALLAWKVKCDRYAYAEPTYDYLSALDERKYIAIVHLKFSHGAVETIKSDPFEAKYVDWNKKHNPGWGSSKRFTTDENGKDYRGPVTMEALCPREMAINWAHQFAPRFNGGRYEANGTVYRESDIISYTVEICEVEEALK